MMRRLLCRLGAHRYSRLMMNAHLPEGGVISSPLPIVVCDHCLRWKDRDVDA